MKKLYSLPNLLFGAALLLSPSVYSQLHIIGPNVTASDVNNSGLVGAGVGSNATAYWTIDSGLQTIGVLANNQLAGETLVSENNDRIIGLATNPETNNNSVGTYTISTGTWSFFETLGGVMDFNTSSSWGISNDGNHIVGLGQLENGNAHAVRWTADGAITDMGSTNEGRYSRANTVNNDGTVIAGWQDAPNGVRQGAIWINGVQSLLTAPDGGNLSEASAVSADGTYAVGAYGVQPYIWSQDSFTLIPHPEAGTFFRGAATDISADGSKVIGFYRAWPGAPHFGEGFIWTEANGRQELNSYVEGLGIDTQGYVLALPLAISPDGTKIVGIARATDYGQFGFYLDLSEYLNSSNQVATSSTIKIFPNPAVDVLNISGLKANAKISITNILGQKVKAEEIQNGKIDVQNLSKGTYIISITENGVTTNHKFIKK